MTENKEEKSSSVSAEENVPDYDKDPFDRQKCIKGWNQPLIASQRVLVLGVGAIGSAVAQFVCRVGVSQVVIVDKDVVVGSNLNRQMLYGPDDVGKRKVDAAAECLRRYHVPDPKATVVKPVHIDAVEHWGDIVRFAKESTVIFNNIDVGGQFDYAVLALGSALHIPVLSGSSFSYIWLSEFFTGKPGATSLSYCPADMAGKTPESDKLTPELIMTYEKLDCIKPDDNPPTRSIGSNAFVAMTAGMTSVQMWVMYLLGNPMPNFVKGDIIRQYDEGLLVFPQQKTSE